MVERQNVTADRISLEGVDQLALFGLNDQYLRMVEERIPCRVTVRNGELHLSGSPLQVRRGVQVFLQLIERVQMQESLTPEEVRDLCEQAMRGGGRKLEEVAHHRIYVPGPRKVIQPKSVGQRVYLEAISQNDIVVSIGPAGTGKTYLAMAAAVEALEKKQVKRMILTRPAVEAGENLGFLPGDLQEKVDPYLRPLYDALADMLPLDRARRALETGTIEIAPLAYMRGRTLNDAFVVLDEAQNTTTMQMKMFLTRLGPNSRVVVTGDKTQIDLPPREESGLLQVERILKGIEGIALVYLTDQDVVRHRLVKEIIKAYESLARGGDRL